MANRVNRIDGNFRALLVHNENRNIFNMTENGNFNLATRNIENISFNKITSISENDSEYRTKKKNMFIISDEGQIVLRSGKENSSLLYNLLNPDFSSADDNFFQGPNTTEINNPFSSTDEVLQLRNNSFLIESTGNKSLCLYSNNGLSQISHSNINLISDNDIILQSSNKLNLTSLGYILLNSERLIGSIEEDIILLSSSGEFKIGGNGATTIGMKINSNLNKNFLGLGKLDDIAQRNLHIDINETSFDKSKKNGIIIDSKNVSNGSTFPEIKLNNFDKSSSVNQNILTSSTLGIGSDNEDSNNLVFVMKENVDNKTFIISLNNFEFTQTDINRKITYSDSNFLPDTIVSIDNTYPKKAEINTFNSLEDITAFGYQKGFINRDNFSYLKTSTDSDLVLGVNNLNVINVKNTGNIGINTYNPTSTMEIKNKFGSINNIRIDKDKKYMNAMAVQMNNGNYVVIFVTEKNSLFNLEYNIYNINNDFIQNSVIHSGSNIFIDFDVDNLKGTLDKFVVVYSYYNNVNIFTEVKIFNNLGVQDNLEYIKTHQYLDISSRPRVKSYSFTIDLNNNNVSNGYLISYLDKNESGDINMDFSLFENNLSNILDNFNITNNIDSKLTDLLELEGNNKSIEKRTIKSMALEHDGNTNPQKFILIFTGEFIIQNNLDNTTETKYFSMLSLFDLDFNSTLVKMGITTNNIFYDFSKENGRLVNNSTDYVIDLSIKEIAERNYIIAYYLKTESSNKTNNLFSIKFNSRTKNFNDERININNNLENTIYNNGSFQSFSRPFISIIDNTDYIVSYYKETTSDNSTIINYYRQSTNTSISLEYTISNNPFVLRTEDSNNNYLGTILFWNNLTTTNTFYQDSINFREIDNTNSILTIQNQNVDLNIKNNGDITIQDILEVSKLNTSTTIKNNLVISGLGSAPTSSTSGINGQINYFGNKLYIYLNGRWKEIGLTDVA